MRVGSRPAAAFPIRAASCAVRDQNPPSGWKKSRWKKSIVWWVTPARRRRGPVGRPVGPLPGRPRGDDGDGAVGALGLAEAREHAAGAAPEKGDDVEGRTGARMRQGWVTRKPGTQGLKPCATAAPNTPRLRHRSTPTSHHPDTKGTLDEGRSAQLARLRAAMCRLADVHHFLLEPLDHVGAHLLDGAAAVGVQPSSITRRR